MDEGFKRLDYVRYADDFIIGVRGSRADTEIIFNKLNEFCSNNLNLTLNREKTKVTQISKEKVKFLGTLIYKSKVVSYSRTSSHQRWLGSKNLSKDKTVLRRNGFILRFDAPIIDIRKK